jgi:hypothetical protein
MKIRPVGAKLFHAADGQTNMTKLIVAFSNFANAPKYNEIWRDVRSLPARSRALLYFSFLRQTLLATDGHFTPLHVSCYGDYLSHIILQATEAASMSLNTNLDSEHGGP